jgi:hypothetical protein
VGVGQRVIDQVGHVPVCQRVEEVGPFPPPDHQPLAPQDPEPLGHGGKLLLERRHDLTDAPLPLRQQGEDAQARGIAQGPEQAGRPL